jgi:hypothetical protein
MSLTRILRTISLQICRPPRTTLPGGTLGNLADRPNSVPRWKQVRGAGSEPHYTAANFHSTGDGKTENFMT